MKLTFNECGFVPFTFSITFEKVEELQAFYDVTNHSRSVASCCGENPYGLSAEKIEIVLHTIRNKLKERFGPIGWGKYRLWTDSKSEAAK